MKRRTLLSSVGSALSIAVAGCLGGPGRASLPEGVEVEPVVEGLDHPWGLVFLPDSADSRSDDGTDADVDTDTPLLVTERKGVLSSIDPAEGVREPLEGIPEVEAAGQGGLLDLAIHPDYPSEPWLYFTYATANNDGETTTALGRGQFDSGPERAGALENVEELYTASPFVDSTNHYGSRVVFGTDRMVYMTVGDRQFKDFGPDHVSQETTNEIGTTLRLEADGSIPDDNPFVDDPEVSDAIFSYGHRNAQGMTVHPETGDLWQSEHGEADGDEINIVEAGGNYGWPIAHTGCEYGTDEPVGDDPDERDDVVDPVYAWECGSGGFPPAGMTIYPPDGDAFPDWQGDLFVGNLAGEYLGRFALEGDGPTVEEVDQLLAGSGWRIRDVTVGPQTGDLYVAVDDTDAPIVRLKAE